MYIGGGLACLQVQMISLSTTGMRTGSSAPPRNGKTNSHRRFPRAAMVKVYSVRPFRSKKERKKENTDSLSVFRSSHCQQYVCTFRTDAQPFNSDIYAVIEGNGIKLSPCIPGRCDITSCSHSLDDKIEVKKYG